MAWQLLLAQACLVVGGFVALTGYVELRAGLRVRSARKNGLKGQGLVQAQARVRADSGSITAPLSGQPAVMFHIGLSRRHVRDTTSRSVEVFLEQRPFSLVDDHGESLRVDKGAVPILGLVPLSRPLPFLPASIAGLLVQRFGKKGALWAHDYVVRATEAALIDGASVHVLLQDGVAQMVSLRPLDDVAAVSLQRGGLRLLVGALLTVGFLLLR